MEGGWHHARSRDIRALVELACRYQFRVGSQLGQNRVLERRKTVLEGPGFPCPLVLWGCFLGMGGLEFG